MRKKGKKKREKTIALNVAYARSLKYLILTRVTGALGKCDRSQSRGPLEIFLNLEVYYSECTPLPLISYRLAALKA